MTPWESAEPLLAIELAGESQTRELGARLADVLRSGGFLGLIGNLGAGKTTLVQGLVGAIATDADVSSPTYTLLNEYDSDPPIYHFDLYRLQNVDELETVAYWDYAENDDAIVIVEWLDRISAAWPGEGVVVVLEHLQDHRSARVWASPGWHTRLREAKLA